MRKVKTLYIKAEKEPSRLWIVAIVAMVIVAVHSAIPKWEMVEYVPMDIPMPTVQTAEIKGASIEVELRKPIPENVKLFVASYPNAKMDNEYLQIIANRCNGDVELLESIVAMAVAETALGRETTFNANYWGWFKDGNRNYDPDKEEMATEIVNGVRNYYPNLTHEAIVIYTGNDNPETWESIYNWAMSEM